MTDCLTALVALKEAVEAGDFSTEADSVMLWNCFPTNTPPVSDNARLAWRAWEGSVDAALSLLAAVLPGWDWQRQSARGIWVVPSCQRLGYFGKNPDPARALLLAIIAAKIEEEQNAR